MALAGRQSSLEAATSAVRITSNALCYSAVRPNLRISVKYRVKRHSGLQHF
jgi:hypothetical protein